MLKDNKIIKKPLDTWVYQINNHIFKIVDNLPFYSNYIIFTEENNDSFNIKDLLTDNEFIMKDIIE